MQDITLLLSVVLSQGIATPQDPLSLNLYTYCHNNPIIGIDPSGHSFKSAWNNYWDGWQNGVDILKQGDYGTVGRRFGNYSQGVVDLLGSQADAIKHPIRTAKTSASKYFSACKSDLRNVNIAHYMGSQMGEGIVNFYSGLATASYNNDWDSVSYQLGGATVAAGEFAATSAVTDAIVGRLSPTTEASFSVSNGLTNGTAPMSVVRTIGRGETVNNLIAEVKALTFETGNEHAVVTLANGERAIVSGGTTGISFGVGEVTNIYGHSHPYQFNATGPSTGDFNALEALNQNSSYLLEHGSVSKFYRKN